MNRFLCLGVSLLLSILVLSFLTGYVVGLPHVVNPLGATIGPLAMRRAHSTGVGNNWLIEVVDAKEITGTHVSLALDHSNRPHIAYVDPASEDLKYAWLNGTIWQTETIEAQGSVGWYVSLALDELDQPHVSYFDSTNADLKYASYNGSIWQIETVDSTGSVGSYTTLALDQLNRPHISYYDGTNFVVKYAWYNGLAWEKEAITTSLSGPVTYPLDISLKLDSISQPHIVYNSCQYYHGANCRVYYVWESGAQWQMESVGYAQFLSLAMDTSGRPHLSEAYFFNWPPGSSIKGLTYYWRDATEWHAEPIASSGGLVSLALDTSNLPHILNEDIASHRLQYHWHDGSIWHSEDVNDVGVWEYERGASLALDNSGGPHIAYYDAVTHQLKYAQRRPMTLSQEAEPQEGLHQGDILNYTVTLDAPDLQVSLWDPLSSGTTYVSDSISSTLLPAAVYSPSVNAILWEGTLPSNTIQTIHFQVSANGIDTGALALPIVNTAWLTDTGNVRSVSVMIIVNAIKSYLPIALKD